MESTCADDLEVVAVVYCACRFPLVPLCQIHAEKHQSDSHGFHFTLPLTAYQDIPSEEVYAQWKPWLFQLNTNFEFLRKKFQLLADGEGHVDSAYQDLLHFASETNKRLQHELSVKKEDFRLEIEKAITETRNYALDMAHQPMHVLEQLLWYYQPGQIVKYQLFDFQAKCIQENLFSTFHIALNFAPSLEDFNMGKSAAPLIQQIEELTKQLASKEESCSAEALSQQLEYARQQEVRSQNELKELNLKVADNQRQYQVLQTNYIQLQIEHESLKKQYQDQATQLKNYRQTNDVLKEKAHLETELRDLNTDFQAVKQQCKQLETDCKLKDESYELLERENKELKSRVDQLQTTLAELNQRNSALEARIRDSGIATHPPIVSQEPVPDYSTPQSRAALAKFGTYSGQDEEGMLVKKGPVVSDNEVYIGQWNAEDIKHGYGKYLCKNGNIYEGQWRNGLRTGRGRFIWASGDVYIGDFVQGNREGFGTLYLANGDEYSGTWVNDTKHGVGSYKYGETSQWAGNRYIGEYLDDLQNGVGAYFWADGRMYVGSSKSNNSHGKGLWAKPAGGMYFGDWADGELAGTGCYVWPDGNVYRGHFEHGKRNGQGQLTHPGKVDSGVWVDDARRS